MALALATPACQALTDRLQPEVDCKKQCPCECRCDEPGEVADKDDKADKADKDSKSDKNNKADKGDKSNKDGKNNKDDKDDRRADSKETPEREAKDLELPSKASDQRPYPVFLAGNVNVTEGSMSRQQARQLVSDRRLELQECYTHALEARPALKGELAMQLTASTRTGQVIAAVVRQSDLGEPQVERCLTDKIQRWTFEPGSDKGLESVVRFDLVMLGVTFDNP